MAFGSLVSCVEVGVDAGDGFGWDGDDSDFVAFAGDA